MILPREIVDAMDEAFLEVRGVDHELGAVIRHHDLADVGGRFRGAGSDLRRVADGVDHAHVIHMDHGNAGRHVGERHQAVGDGDYLIRVLRVHDRVGQNAAVALAAVGLHVAVLVAGRRADERDVDMDLAGLDGADAAAVGAHDRQITELSCGNGLADLAADAGGLDTYDGSVLDHGNDGIMSLAQGGRADGDPLDAHVVDLFHDHIDNVVALAEMMMEGNGHAVLDSAFYQSLVDVLHHLAPLRIAYRVYSGSGLGILIIIIGVSAFKYLLAGSL